MTQLSITSAVPQGSRSPSPPEKEAPRERRGRDSRSRTPLRTRAENAARELHPDADRVLINASHIEGPVVEVYKGREMLGLYRYTGYEV